MSNFAKVESAARGINRIQTGCMFLFANLLFTGFCLWGVYMLYVSVQLETKGKITEGIVVEMDASTTDGSTTYSPIIEFEANGETHSFKGNISSNPPQYSIGDRVDVRFDPGNPNTAQIDKSSERWLTPILLIPAMLIAAIIVNFFLIRAWRRGDSMDN
ncbi:DUF3592 domain-containing protein [Candidatus Villigracilis saccharophilus]|uniref:DUF3592 domain-containing protein n=1 Tax=Candidatus Villigracilis saccharophilus TaxID=3140684 RepID=UPI0031346E2C|nr:DUF3592 domain-containing protein [Anaerolineales bacterium]